MDKRSAKILHLTDLHLFDNQKTKMVGINPLETLQTIVKKISDGFQQNRPDLTVLTGDISQDYSLESYKTAAKILQQLPCPLVTTMGNHDYASSFAKVFDNSTQLVTKISHLTDWRILLLNTHWAEHVEGQLIDTDYAFLQEKLAEDTKHPVIIFLHHHVLPVASLWLDKIMLQNSPRFLEIVTQYKNVKVIVCGHVHQDTSAVYKDVAFLSTPATCWQFTVKNNGFKLDTLMPGYRWITLGEDGTIQTEVVRLDHNDAFVPDINSKGY